MRYNRLLGDVYDNTSCVCSNTIYSDMAFCPNCGKVNPKFDLERHIEMTGESHEDIKKISCSPEGHSAVEDDFCMECGKRILPN